MTIDEPDVYVMLGRLSLPAAPTTVAVHTKLGVDPPVVNAADGAKFTVTVLELSVANPIVVCGLETADAGTALMLSPAVAVGPFDLSVPPVFVTESMILSPAVTPKLPEIVQAVVGPVVAIVHVVPWITGLISSRTVKLVPVPETADEKVNVALVRLPVEATVVTSQVPIVVLEQLLESEAYRVVVLHVTLLIAPLEKLALDACDPVSPR